jgi:hypothetical protein
MLAHEAMNTHRLLLIVACSFVPVGFATEPERPSDVPVQVNPAEPPEERKPAIVVRAPTKISASAKNPLEYSYEIHNLLPYQVFVEVSTDDTASLNIEDNEDGIRGGGGMSAVPHRSTLRLLLAAKQHEGQPPMGCCCSSTTATIRIDLSEDESLDHYVGWTGTVDFCLIGYRRSDGAEFCESIKVPVEIVK